MRFQRGSCRHCCVLGHHHGDDSMILHHLFPYLAHALALGRGAIVGLSLSLVLCLALDRDRGHGRVHSLVADRLYRDVTGVG